MRKKQNFLIKADLPIHSGRRQAAISQIRRAAEDMNFKPRITIWELIRSQLSYISMGCWLGQGAFVAFAAFIFYRMGDKKELTEYMACFSAVAAVAGVIGVTELARHFACKSAEVEQSCYFQLEQLWMMKMILFSGVDILVLSALTGGIADRTGAGAWEVSVYLLVPFVLSNACYLLLITGSRGGGGRYTQIAVSILLGIAAMLPSMNPRAYKANYLWVWTLLLAAGIALLIREVCVLRRKITKGETLCWN